MKFFFLILLFSSTSIFAKTYEIQMLNKDGKESMIFKPQVVKAQVGDKVVFIPTDKGHTSQSVFLPENAISWKGKVSKKVEVSLKEEGVYIYECQNHGIMGMVGIIQVGKPTNLEAAKKFFKKFQKKFVMNKNRFDNNLIK